MIQPPMEASTFKKQYFSQAGIRTDSVPQCDFRKISSLLWACLYIHRIRDLGLCVSIMFHPLTKSEGFQGLICGQQEVGK